MISVETIVDSKTGHTIEVGTWNQLWGFHCVTCDRWYARKVYEGFDHAQVMVDLVDQHTATITSVPR